LRSAPSRTTSPPASRLLERALLYAARRDVEGLAGLSAPGLKARVQRGRRKLAELLAECCEVELDARGTVTRQRRVGRCACPP
jgi:RNA polymerase sigma-70 factor (ECF subfamily)